MTTDRSHELYIIYYILYSSRKVLNKFRKKFCHTCQVLIPSQNCSCN